MKEKILNSLYELGFHPVEIPDYGYLFTYEGSNLVFKHDADDPYFLRIIEPFLYEMDDENERPFILNVINDVNNRIKYGKVILHDDSVLASMEYRLTDDADTDEILEFVLSVIKVIEYVFNLYLNGAQLEPSKAEDDNKEIDDEQECFTPEA